MNNGELFRASQKKHEKQGREIAEAGKKQLERLSIEWKGLNKNLDRKMKEARTPKKI